MIKINLIIKPFEDFFLAFGSAEIIFRVALVLLEKHKELILQCISFEQLNDVLKSTLPSMSYIQTERIFSQVYLNLNANFWLFHIFILKVCKIDLSMELFKYKVEYDVLKEDIYNGDAGLLMMNDSRIQQNVYHSIIPNVSTLPSDIPEVANRIDSSLTKQVTSVLYKQLFKFVYKDFFFNSRMQS